MEKEKLKSEIRCQGCGSVWEIHAQPKWEELALLECQICASEGPGVID